MNNKQKQIYDAGYNMGYKDGCELERVFLSQLSSILDNMWNKLEGYSPSQQDEINDYLWEEIEPFFPKPKNSLIIKYLGEK